jgi:GrpB-like predicted nucleotidyltransferase (UPF0157 family)
MDRSELDEHLDRVLVGGRQRREIVIADYDPAWPARFEAGRDRVARALGDHALTIEHIGSTSVPGLGAKPIIDVLVTVADPDDEAAFREPLERAGYELAERRWDDMNHYADAKGPFIEEVLRDV